VNGVSAGQSVKIKRIRDAAYSGTAEIGVKSIVPWNDGGYSPEKRSVKEITPD
jgi:hypothetical protein